MQVIVVISIIVVIASLLWFYDRQRLMKLWQRESAKSLWEQQYTPTEMPIVITFLGMFCQIWGLWGYEKDENIYKLRPDEKPADILHSIQSPFGVGGMEELEFVVWLETACHLDIEVWTEWVQICTDVPTFGGLIDYVIAHGHLQPVNTT